MDPDGPPVRVHYAGPRGYLARIAPMLRSFLDSSARVQGLHRDISGLLTHPNQPRPDRRIWREIDAFLVQVSQSGVGLRQPVAIADLEHRHFAGRVDAQKLG